MTSSVALARLTCWAGRAAFSAAPHCTAASSLADSYCDISDAGVEQTNVWPPRPLIAQGWVHRGASSARPLQHLSPFATQYCPQRPAPQFHPWSLRWLHQSRGSQPADNSAQPGTPLVPATQPVRADPSEQVQDAHRPQCPRPEQQEAGRAGGGSGGGRPSRLQWAQPYLQLMRLDKPIGTWLLFWPCAWSITMAAAPGHWPDPWLLALFAAGAVLLRGAGCTVNDLWDRDLDAAVARTRSRPLASGALQPHQALAFLALQLSLGLLILLQLNTFSQVLGASSLLLVATYPLMKRVTFWPQAFLGLTINWGALLGWAAVHGSCEWRVVAPLYAAGVCWSLVYDTIYAHQDKHDDAQVGIRSTALALGDKGTRPALTAFTALQVACLSAAGQAAMMGPAYYAGVGAMGLHLLHQVWTVDLNNGSDCSAKFVSNRVTGALLAAGCVAGRLMPLA
ncbi:mitochondrial 4-hydroxybenzoate polyprenyltransferase [Haematococcus lacustris]